MRAKDDHPLFETDMGVGVTRVWIDTPLEDGAWDVNRAGDDPIAPSLVHGAKIDEHRPVPRRLEGICRFKTGGDTALCLGEQLRRCSA